MCLSFYVCPYLCLRSGKSLVLWAGTFAMSLTTVTGSVPCSTSTSTAKTAPSLGMLSSTSLVGKPAHRDLGLCVYVWGRFFTVCTAQNTFTIHFWKYNIIKSNVQSITWRSDRSSGFKQGRKCGWKQSLSVTEAGMFVVLPVCGTDSTLLFCQQHTRFQHYVKWISQSRASVTRFHSVLQLWARVCSSLTQWTFAAVFLLALCL